MGEDMRAAKRVVPPRPHPAAPDQPPGSIAAAAVVDPGGRRPQDRGRRGAPWAQGRRRRGGRLRAGEPARGCASRLTQRRAASRPATATSPSCSPRAADEQEDGSQRQRAMRRASRAALGWDVRAVDVVAAGLPLTTLPRVGPWLAEVIGAWIAARAQRAAGAPAAHRVPGARRRVAHRRGRARLGVGDPMRPADAHPEQRRARVAGGDGAALHRARLHPHGRHRPLRGPAHRPRHGRGDARRAGGGGARAERRARRGGARLPRPPRPGDERRARRQRRHRPRRPRRARPRPRRLPLQAAPGR